MTTELARPRDQRTKLALENAVREALISPAPTEVRVSARDNHSFEPSFYVSVTMPSQADIPDSTTQNQRVVKMMGALERIDEDRYPYLYFGPYEQEADLSDEEGDFGRDEDLL